MSTATQSFLSKTSPLTRSFVIALCILSFTSLFILTPFDYYQNKYEYKFKYLYPSKEKLNIFSIDRTHLDLGTLSDPALSTLSHDSDSFDLTNSDSSTSHQYAYKHAAVSCDVKQCSDLGTDILKRGGSAVDAAVTVSLCLGSVNSFSSGIGGGGFMIVRMPSNFSQDSSSESSHSLAALDFREKAPGAAFRDMYQHNTNLSKIGGLAVAIPGELKGLYEAYTRFTSGKLSWADLVNPVAELNEKGFKIELPLATALHLVEPILLQHSEYWGWLLTNATKEPTTTTTATSTNSDIATDSVPTPTSPGFFGAKLRVKEMGETVTRPAYAKTLRLIAKNGSADVFYDPEGPITPHLVDTIQSAGGIATTDDFAKYNVEVSEPLVSHYHGRKVYTCRNPSSGPVLQFGLNVLSTFHDGNKDDADFESRCTHTLVETMKYMGAARSELGDITAFSNNSARINRLSDPAYALSISKNISNTKTHPWQYYAPSYDAQEPHGTTHFSVMDAYGGAVGMTTTVNLFFGSFLCDKTTGIVLNNQMDDFSVPNTTNSFGLQASIHNFVEPYKRPVSSISPVIVVKDGVTGSGEDGDALEMVLGASGGSRITTTVVQELVRKLYYNLSLAETIKRPRIHHQLLPDSAFVENNWPQYSVDDLKSKGHAVEWMGPASVSNGLFWNQDKKVIVAVADWWRKRGTPGGF